MSNQRIARVIFPIGIDKEFDYSAAGNAKIKKGSRVLVEFNRSEKVGMVVSFSRHPQVKNVKPIIRILDSNPCLSNEALAFARKLARDYLYCWGEIVFMMIPSYLRQKHALQSAVLSENKPQQDDKPEFIQRNTFSERFAVYKQQIRQMLKANSVVLCFPFVSYLEKAKTELDEDLLEKSVIIHSYQSPKDNLNNWLISRQGKKLVMGVRSALFCYPPDTGLVIIEQENSPYYSQPEKPYYHLVDVAWSLYEFRKIKLILADDYPSLHSYKKYRQGKIDFLSRQTEQKKTIEVFDFRDLQSRRRSIFTPLVIELMRKNLEDNKKILLIWSRKNFSAILRCDKCGYVLQCQRCSSPLRLSLEKHLSLCSWCGYSEDITSLCAKCASGYIKPIGVGIERLASMVRKIFPEYEAKRLEHLSPATKIVLSTSKITFAGYDPGYDFQACFVLDIDNFLSKVDYAATFDTFIYLTKLTRMVKKNIYIFTHHLQHYLWQALTCDWTIFYEKELKIRKKLDFPPYGRIVKITIRSKNENTLLKRAQNIYNSLGDAKLDVFGPMEEVPFKLRDYYRYSVIVKVKDSRKAIRLIDSVIAGYRSSACKLAVAIR